MPRFFSFLILSFFTTVLLSQITKYPLLEYSSADNLVIKEINIMNSDDKLDNYTVVSFEYAPVQDEYFMIPKGMFIVDSENANNRYELICFYDQKYQAGLWYPVTAGQLYNYSLIFEHIDACVNQINIREPKLPDLEPWIWRNVIVKNTCTRQIARTETMQEAKSSSKPIIGY